MGCQLFYRNNNLPSIGDQALIKENISEGLEAMNNIPDDQILCPKCKRIPEILNVHTDNGLIELKCNYHGELELSIEEYAKALDKSSYFKIKCYNCNELQKNKENMYQYCPFCKVDLCQTCVNKHPDIGLGEGKQISIMLKIM
jgi:hypothetical protein